MNFEPMPKDEDIEVNFTEIIPESSSNLVPSGPNTVMRSGEFTSPNYSKDNAGWAIKANGDVEFGNGKFRGDITGASGVIGVIKTASSGARVELTDSNNIDLYDDTSSSGGTVSGNAAELRFIRTDDANRYYTFRKRVGKDDDSDNVLELFSSAPATNKKNFLFLGRDGTGSNVNLNVIDEIATYNTSIGNSINNGTVGLSVGLNNAVSTNYHLLITAARNVYGDDAKAGVAALLTCSGADGLAGIGYYSGGGYNIVLYTDLNGFINIGATSIPDTDNAWNLGTSSKQYKDLRLGTAFYYKAILQPVQYQGFVNADGTAGGTFPTGWTAGKDSTGNYTVTHSFNSAAYTVTISPRAAAVKMCAITAKAANSFSVRIADAAGAAEDNIFEFLLLK